MIEITNKIRNHLNGIARGVVEDNMDPSGCSKLRVRIPALHGIPGQSPNFLKNDELPWANMSVMSAGPGRGTSILPNKGDIVWVAFEDDNMMKPVVLGCAFTPAAINAQKEDDPNATGDGTTVKGHIAESTPASGNDKGSGAAQVLYKSKKGAELGFYEEDKKETFRITDSIGQIIEFGAQSPKGASARSKGDRTRKPVEPEGLHGKGYILIQIAADPDEGEEEMPDPKLFLAPNLYHAENGTSKISAEKDHIVLHNGKSAIDVKEQNIKISNQVSSIDIIHDSGSNGDKVIVTNGSGVTITLDGDKLDITASGDINITAGGTMNLKGSKINLN